MAYLGNHVNIGGVINAGKDVPSSSIIIEGRPIAVRRTKVDRAARVAVDCCITVQLN